MADSLGGILTNGLGSDSTAMILGPFRLQIFIDVEDVGLKRPGGVAAAFPIRRDDDDEKQELKKLVCITVKMGENEIYREYIVSKEGSDKIVEIANFINKTLQNMSVSITNFKSKFKNITTQFTKKNSN
jgi:hypothetical protein